MTDSIKPKFEFDPALRTRLRIIEQMAELTPVDWSDMGYGGKPGEIEKFRRLREQIEGNIKGLERLMIDPETRPEYYTLAKSLRLQLVYQWQRTVSIIENIEKQLLKAE